MQSLVWSGFRDFGTGEGEGGVRGGGVLERLRESVIETQQHISLHRSHRLCVL